MGLEPTTATLATWRSTTELHPHGWEFALLPYPLRIINVTTLISREVFQTSYPELLAERLPPPR
jgi:hypothetical protein